MKTGTLTIGVAVDTVGAAGRRIFMGIAAYARVVPHWVLRTRPFYAFAEGGKVEEEPLDGLIIAIADFGQLQRVERLPFPVVIVSTLDQRVRASVRPDHREIARVVARDFLARGYTRFAFSGNPVAPFSNLRGKEFVRFLKEAGFGCETRGLYVGEPAYSTAEGLPELEGWLGGLAHPTALFACNDINGREVLERLWKMGVAVPEKVAVVGVDNDEMICAISRPPLSSVDTNARQIGFAAAGLLDRQLRGEKLEEGELQQEVGPTGLIVRESSDSTALADSEAAQAARFIRENAHLAIGVEDVVAAVPLSRRPLERRFQRVLGRSILEEIHRTRVERAKGLLATTELPVSTVAKMSGFVSSARFGIIFGRLAGLTPSEFRKRNAR